MLQSLQLYMVLKTLSTSTQDIPLPLLSLFHAKNRAYTNARMTQLVHQASLTISEAEALLPEVNQVQVCGMIIVWGE